MRCVCTKLRGGSMYLHCFRSVGFRNLVDVNLSAHPSLNIITGPNGSGKTSILEAIHVLSMGRSFRTNELQPVITYDQPRLICYGEVEKSGKLFSIGLEKRSNSPLILQANGETGLKLSKYIGTFVTQLITPDSFSLLTTGPEIRRKFIDLGVFHVKHSYIEHSSRYKRLLRQRNAALKQNASPMVIRAIDEGLVDAGEHVSMARAEYLNEFMPIFNDVLKRFLPNVSVNHKYLQGWSSEKVCFGDAIRGSFEQDLRYRTTSVGPHRADLKFLVQGFPAQQILSRGQQKLFVCALILAQSVHLSIKKSVKSVFLIDDLTSELDKHNLSLILNWLFELGHQLFLTSVDEAIWLSLCDETAHEMFHVKHGKPTLRSLVK